MDSLNRGNYGGDDVSAEAPGIETPAMIGQDERRMHVRAYNFWAKLLDGRSFPAIESLDVDAMGDFGPNALLLDFTAGLENPAISFVGESLARECELGDAVQYINDVPRGSLLSRLTDHYLQIIANRAPIGFEAEFVNSRGATILYRGVLLPFSSDDDTIDFILGVINWKQAAEPELVDALAEEMAAAASVPHPHRATVPVWADGPETGGDQDGDMPSLLPSLMQQRPADMPAQRGPLAARAVATGLPSDGLFDDDDDALMLDTPLDTPLDAAPLMAVGDDAEFDVPTFDAADASLADWLANARDCADVAAQANARGHAALYQAIGRACGFARATDQSPEDYQELLDEAGIAVSPRSPMTPVVKLVFGAQHDKTRLAEYAAVLGYAVRQEIAPDALPTYLSGYKGGLKGLVRDIRRESRPEAAAPDSTEAVIAALRQADAIGDVEMTDFVDEDEFIVLIARREESGELSVVAQLPGRDALTQRAIKAAAKRMLD